VGCGMEMSSDSTPQLRVDNLTDFHCLKGFESGIEKMDEIIHNDFYLSVENHYCTAFKVTFQSEIIAVFALSYDSLDLDTDDKEELKNGISIAETPGVNFNYEEVFYSKSHYPALEITYLAVRKDWRGKKVGTAIISKIADMARKQNFAGCQFLTVEAYITDEYSAQGFYSKNGFAPSEIKAPYKDTLRMFKTLYPE
jgi:GNAT superfamily N-acetyltransferase